MNLWNNSFFTTNSSSTKNISPQMHCWELSKILKQYFFTTPFSCYFCKNAFITPCNIALKFCFRLITSTCSHSRGVLKNSYSEKILQSRKEMSFDGAPFLVKASPWLFFRKLCEIFRNCSVEHLWNSNSVLHHKYTVVEINLLSNHVVLLMSFAIGIPLIFSKNQTWKSCRCLQGNLEF